MLDWLVAYLITCAIEIPIVVAVLLRLGWIDRRFIGRAAGVAWSLQLTHPVLWLFGPWSLGPLVAAEVVVTLVEGAALALLASHYLSAERLSRRVWTLALATSAIANGISFAIGLVGYTVLA